MSVLKLYFHKNEYSVHAVACMHVALLDTTLSIGCYNLVSTYI